MSGITTFSNISVSMAHYFGPPKGFRLGHEAIGLNGAGVRYRSTLSRY